MPLPLLFAGLALFVGTGLINPGLVAMDDYFMLVANAVPSQHLTAAQVIASADIRSPLPSLVAFGLARVALWLGWTSPTAQLRFVLAVLGGFSFGMLTLGLKLLYEDLSTRRMATVLTCFYFLTPLLLSRLMVESLAAPFLFVSAAFATRRRFVTALVFLSVAAVLRPQAGVCVLALFAMVRRPRDLFILLGAGIALFVLTGLPDLVLRGSFHRSLVLYVDYNLHHSSDYGTTPFYMPLLLFVALTLPPFSIARFKGFEWRSEYRPYLPALAYLAIFVGAHALVPHKEERFFIPILPLYLALLAPLAQSLAEIPWRRNGWLALNGILLVLAVTNTPQKNVLDLVAYLERTPRITKIVGVEDTLVLYPDAFLTRKLATALVKKEDDVPAVCGTVVVVRKDLESATAITRTWKKVREFSPAFLESIVVRLNPGPNRRRGTLSLFAPAACSDFFAEVERVDVVELSARR